MKKHSYLDELNDLLTELSSTDNSWRSNPIYSEAEKQTALLELLVRMIATKMDKEDSDGRIETFHCGLVHELA